MKFQKVAFIRESECIGCTKCIDACPVDAIIGTSKQMHTIIANECITCQLCIEPCPVDCIDLIERKESIDPNHLTQKARKRIQNRKARFNQTKPSIQDPSSDKKAYINAALERIKGVKNNH